MKLRYRIDINGYYIPQYEREDKWFDFKVKHLTKKLKNLCNYLGFEGKWETRYHYFPKKDEKLEDTSLIFPEEMYVMAFLGAAKSVYDEKIREFDV